MSGPYHSDSANFGLGEFKRTLETEELFPSRQLLREEIEHRFAALERTGIRNLKQLAAADRCCGCKIEYDLVSSILTQLLNAFGQQFSLLLILR